MIVVVLSIIALLLTVFIFIYVLKPTTQHQQQQDWSREFAAADLDHDGTLSAAEFQQYYSNKMGVGGFQRRE